ncbi:MAG: hypothetical protein ACK5PB_13505 [Pirellula sp.]
MTLAEVLVDFRSLFKQTADYGYSALSTGWSLTGAGVGYVTKMVGGLSLFGSTVTTAATQQYDERHYFLIPDKRCEDGYVLCIMRCLPEGVPPINDLSKRRLLHLPHADAESMLRSLLIKRAQAEELAKPNDRKTLADRTREVADYIDALDEKVFGGILLIGGLVAIFNPLAGAAIAAKSLIPSLGMFASKYGLRMAEESLSHANMQSKAKQAEADILKQFKESLTENHVNPLLTILDRALRTTEDQFDPMLELHAYLQSELNIEQKQWLRLTSKAILDVFDEALKSNKASVKAGLGKEDVRFLEVLQSLVSDTKA